MIAMKLLKLKEYINPFRQRESKSQKSHVFYKKQKSTTRKQNKIGDIRINFKTSKKSMFILGLNLR